MGACALHDPPPADRCEQPAVYEMDVDGDENWIPLCVWHGPMYRRSSNVRIRTRRPAPFPLAEADQPHGGTR